jgi:hypothetical protein
MTGMSKLIEQEHFLNPFFALLEETFEIHHGIFLDNGTSLFQTLELINAEQASIPVGGKCASLAAQVAHVTFYLELLERIIVHNDTTPVDWGEIWRTVEKVSPEQWQALKDSLKQAYTRLTQLFRDNPNWNEDAISGALATVVHTAYHLGEIRQALCFLR